MTTNYHTIHLSHHIASHHYQLQFQSKHMTARAKWHVPDSFPNPLVAQAYFHPQANRDPEGFAWSLPVRSRIRDFCSAVLGYTSAQMDASVDPVLKRFAERSYQSRMDSHYRLTYNDDARYYQLLLVSC